MAVAQVCKLISAAYSVFQIPPQTDLIVGMKAFHSLTAARFRRLEQSKRIAAPAR